MSGIDTKGSSRRAFVLSGGVALGGVATAVGASASETGNSLRQQLASAQDREAIRQLHLTFARLIENQAYEALPALFDDHALLELSGAAATGKEAIQQLFAEQYRQQKATTIHSVYRPNALQIKDTLTVDGTRAAATWHVDVKVSTPLQEDCTAAQMARLQGQMAECHWDSGCLHARYVKAGGDWKMASLIYHADAHGSAQASRSV